MVTIAFKGSHFEPDIIPWVYVGMCVAELFYAQLDGAPSEDAAGAEWDLFRGQLEVVVQGANIDGVQRGAELRQFKLEFSRELFQRHRQLRLIARLLNCLQSVERLRSIMPRAVVLRSARS